MAKAGKKPTSSPLSSAPPPVRRFHLSQEQIERYGFQLTQEQIERFRQLQPPQEQAEQFWQRFRSDMDAPDKATELIDRALAHQIWGTVPPPSHSPAIAVTIKATPCRSKRVKQELAARWVQKAYPEYAPESIPAEISAATVQRKIERLGGPLFSLTTLQRAMGRRKI